MDEEYWKARRCMLEPVPEIFEAAVLLGAAADFHADGKEDDARNALRAADLPAILDWCEQLWGGRGSLDAYRRSPVHRFRDVPDLPAKEVLDGPTSRPAFSVKCSTETATSAVSAGFQSSGRRPKRPCVTRIRKPSDGAQEISRSIRLSRRWILTSTTSFHAAAAVGTRRTTLSFHALHATAEGGTGCLRRLA